MSGLKRLGSEITIQNCIETKRLDQIIIKQAITVLNKSVSLCHDVVGAIVFTGEKREKEKNSLPLV